MNYFRKSKIWNFRGVNNFSSATQNGAMRWFRQKFRLPWRTAPHEYSVYTEYFFSISAVYTQYFRKNPFFSNIFKSEWSIYFVYTFKLVKKTDLSGKYIYILGISLIYSCWKKCISTDSGKKLINFGEASKNVFCKVNWMGDLSSDEQIEFQK